MATRNIVPRTSGEGQLGRTDKKWSKVIAIDGEFTDITMPGGSVLPSDDNATDSAHTWSAAKINTEIGTGGGGAGIGGITTDLEIIAITDDGGGDPLNITRDTTGTTNITYDLNDWIANTGFNIAKVRGVFIESDVASFQASSAYTTATIQSGTYDLTKTSASTSNQGNEDSTTTFIPLNELEETFDVSLVVNTGTGTASAGITIKAVQQIKHEAEIATSDIEYIPITGTNGTPALNQETVSATGTFDFVYDIADFIGTGFRPNDVRGVYVTTEIHAQDSSGGAPEIWAKYDGVWIQIASAYTMSGSWDEATYTQIIPINKDQTQIELRHITNTSTTEVRCITNIFGIHQANLQLIDASTLSMAGKIGEVIAWPGFTAPADFLECDGTSISRPKSAGGTTDDYLELWNIIGTRYGIGDGSTTFNKPDYRGQFLRGYDHLAGIDPDAGSRTDSGDGTTGDNVGTKQGHMYEEHLHTADAYPGNSPAAGPQFQPSNLSGGLLDSNLSGGSETRPVNVSVMWCIRYIGAPENQSAKTLTVANNKYIEFTGTTDNGGSLTKNFTTNNETVTFQLGNFSGDGLNYPDIRDIIIQCYLSVATTACRIFYTYPNGIEKQIFGISNVGDAQLINLRVPVNPGQTEIAFKYEEDGAGDNASITVLGADQIFYEDGTIVYAGTQGSEYWELETTLPSASSTTIVPHTLTKKPTLVNAVAVAKATAPSGFVTGREYEIGISEGGGGVLAALQIGYDSTNLYIQVATGGTFFVVSDAGAMTVAQAADFDVKYQAWTQIPISDEIEIYETPDITIAANTLLFAHGLSQKPTNLEFYLICVDVFGNLGYAEGDVVSHQSHTKITLGSDATNVYVSLGTAVLPSIIPKTGGIETAINPTSWKMRVKAIKDGSAKVNLPHNYLAGYKLTCPNASATFTIGAGQATDITNVSELKIDAAMQKDIGLAWSAGDGGGAKPAGVTIATDDWMHVFVFKNIFGVIDIAIDDNVNATHIVNTLNAVYYRRVCSIQCLNATTLKGLTVQGDMYRFMIPEIESSAFPDGTTLYTLSTPSGVRCTGIISSAVTTDGGGDGLAHAYFDDGLATETIVPDSGGPYHAAAAYASGNQIGGNGLLIPTDTSSRIRVHADGCSGSSLTTEGWFDNKGKDD